MSLPYLYNQTLNYTVNIIVDPIGLSFVSLYPLISVLLILAPIIFFSIILALKKSYRIKSLLFFLNMVFSGLIPTIANSLMTYFSIQEYVYNAVLDDQTIYSLLLNNSSIILAINQNITPFALGMILLNVIFMVYYMGLAIKERQNI